MSADPLNTWLTVPEQWDPGFAPVRRVVIAEIGVFKRVFAAPPGFVPQFFHRVIDLPIEEWSLEFSRSLLSGFCVVHARLQIRFQAEAEFVASHPEAVPEVNAFIRDRYRGVVIDTVEQVLLADTEHRWIREGLEQVEHSAAERVNEILIEQGLAARTLCQLSADFPPVDDPPEPSPGHFQNQRLVLEWLRRQHILREERQRELFGQHIDRERLRLEQSQRSHEQARQSDSLVFQEQQRETERLQAELSEAEKRHRERLAAEERMTLERLQQRVRLRDTELALEKEETQRLTAELAEREAQARMRAEHRRRLREIEWDEARLEKEQRFENSEKDDEYLRREIELLILEKRRAELESEVRAAKEPTVPDLLDMDLSSFRNLRELPEPPKRFEES